MRVTPSARTELLEAVARLKRWNPEEARRFVLEVEGRFAELEEGLDEVAELKSAKHSATASSGHRFFVRERTNGLWLIAIWPERSIREGHLRASKPRVGQ